MAKSTLLHPQFSTHLILAFIHPTNREESLKEFVTLTITPSSVRQRRLRLVKNFTRENAINKPGMISLLGRDGTKHQTRLLFDKGKGIMYLGSGWKDFAEANGLKTGDSFTLKLIWEDKTPMLSLCPAECGIDRGGEQGCSKTKQKKSLPTKPSNPKKISKDLGREKTHLNLGESFTLESAREDITPTLSLFCSESSSSNSNEKESIQNRFVTLTLTVEDVRACMLILPSQFMKDNGINKLGKITILGENGMEWPAFLLTRDGTVALENGWDKFCEANGVQLGECFTLDFRNEPDKTTRVLKFCSLGD